MIQLSIKRVSRLLVLLISFYIIPIISRSQCVAPGSSVSFSNTGQNTSPGYSTMYVLTDANGGILATNLTNPFTAPSGMGNYKIYAVNYQGTAPVVIVGNNMNNLTGNCFATSFTPFCVDDVCIDKGTSLSFTAAGENSNPEYSTAYVLVNNANNQILNNVSSPFTVPSTEGSYSVYTVNWLNTQTAPVLTPGTNINSTGGSCVAKNSFMFSVCNTLPVRLLAFGATTSECKAILKWRSATETGFSEYQVEYSLDGASYTVVETIRSKGDNSEYAVSYPVQGMGYYRLKIVDHNGNYEYSDVKTINVGCNALGSLIYPNPAKEVLTISLSNLRSRGVATLYDAIGREVLTQFVVNGNNHLDVRLLSAGIYVLRIATTNGVENHKIAISSKE